MSESMSSLENQISASQAFPLTKACAFFFEGGLTDISEALATMPTAASAASSSDISPEALQSSVYHQCFKSFIEEATRNTSKFVSTLYHYAALPQSRRLALQTLFAVCSTEHNLAAQGMDALVATIRDGRSSSPDYLSAVLLFRAVAAACLHAFSRAGWPPACVESTINAANVLLDGAIRLLGSSSTSAAESVLSVSQVETLDAAAGFLCALCQMSTTTSGVGGALAAGGSGGGDNFESAAVIVLQDFSRIKTFVKGLQGALQVVFSNRRRSSSSVPAADADGSVVTASSSSAAASSLYCQKHRAVGAISQAVIAAHIGCPPMVVALDVLVCLLSCSAPNDRAFARRSGDPSGEKNVILAVAAAIATVLPCSIALPVPHAVSEISVLTAAFLLSCSCPPPTSATVKGTTTFDAAAGAAPYCPVGAGKSRTHTSSSSDWFISSYCLAISVCMASVGTDNSDASSDDDPRFDRLAAALDSNPSAWGEAYRRILRVVTNPAVLPQTAGSPLSITRALRCGAVRVAASIVAAMTLAVPSKVAMPMGTLTVMLEAAILSATYSKECATIAASDARLSVCVSLCLAAPSTVLPQILDFVRSDTDESTRDRALLTLSILIYLVGPGKRAYSAAQMLLDRGSSKSLEYALCGAVCAALDALSPVADCRTIATHLPAETALPFLVRAAVDPYTPKSRLLLTTKAIKSILCTAPSSGDIAIRLFILLDGIATARASLGDGERVSHQFLVREAQLWSSYASPGSLARPTASSPTHFPPVYLAINYLVEHVESKIVPVLVALTASTHSFSCLSDLLGHAVCVDDFHGLTVGAALHIPHCPLFANIASPKSCEIPQTVAPFLGAAVALRHHPSSSDIVRILRILVKVLPLSGNEEAISAIIIHFICLELSHSESFLPSGDDSSLYRLLYPFLLLRMLPLPLLLPKFDVVPAVLDGLSSEATQSLSTPVLLFRLCAIVAGSPNIPRDVRRVVVEAVAGASPAAAVLAAFSLTVKRHRGAALAIGMACLVGSPMSLCHYMSSSVGYAVCACKSNGAAALLGQQQALFSSSQFMLVAGVHLHITGWIPQTLEVSPEKLCLAACGAHFAHAAVLPSLLRGSPSGTLSRDSQTDEMDDVACISACADIAAASVVCHVAHAMKGCAMCHQGGDNVDDVSSMALLFQMMFTKTDMSTSTFLRVLQAAEGMIAAVAAVPPALNRLLSGNSETGVWPPAVSAIAGPYVFNTVSVCLSILLFTLQKSQTQHLEAAMSRAVAAGANMLLPTIEAFEVSVAVSHDSPELINRFYVTVRNVTAIAVRGISLLSEAAHIRDIVPAISTLFVDEAVPVLFVPPCLRVQDLPSSAIVRELRMAGVRMCAALLAVSASISSGHATATLVQLLQNITASSDREVAEAAVNVLSIFMAKPAAK